MAGRLLNWLGRGTNWPAGRPGGLVIRGLAALAVCSGRMADGLVPGISRAHLARARRSDPASRCGSRPMTWSARSGSTGIWLISG